MSPGYDRAPQCPLCGVPVHTAYVNGVRCIELHQTKPFVAFHSKPYAIPCPASGVVLEAWR